MTTIGGDACSPPGMRDPRWRDAAACRGMDSAVFFPEPVGDHGGERSESQRARADEREALAKRTCGSCQVVADCLAYAMETHQRDGVWGGTNQRERERLRRARKTPTRQGMAS